MNIILEHKFLTTSHDLLSLFDKTHKLATFCSKLEKQASLDIARYSYNDYIGDGFEFFIELLVRLSPTDNRIGLSNYHPIQSHDNGCDGYATNLNNLDTAIQIKYRSDHKKTLSSVEDNLNSFITEALLEKSIQPEKTAKIKNHYIFTTAAGLHYYTENDKFRNCVKCFGYEEIRELVDNNTHFWNMCVEIIKENLKLTGK